MGFVDLHTHTTFSDGSLKPGELVDYACEKGLSAIAITDHDTVDGLSAAMRMAIKRPVEVIPGVELTSRYNHKEVHILGYFVNYEDITFVKMLRVITKYKIERNEKICSQLRTHGIDVDTEELKKKYSSRVFNRAHLAEYMIECGYVKDRFEAYDRYLGEGKPCYIPQKVLSPFDAATIIKRAGGIPCIAHPVKYGFTNEEYIKFFTYMKEAGISGIEAIYSENTYEDEKKFKNYADKLNLFITGGSDFHGLIKPDIDLGTGKGNLMISRKILDNLKKAAE